MKVNSVHERVFAATADELAALVADFERIWPTEIGPVPRPVGGRVYQAGMMVWEEFDRPGAIRAFRVVSPNALRGEHWFDLERVHEGVRLRHTIAGEAVGEYETIWRERIEPAHDQILDALLDKIELVVSGPSTKLIPSRRPGCTQARRP
jgi:hypothetical protein